MPTYEYVCKNCAVEFEIKQSFYEAPLVTCPTCKTDSLKKIFSNVGIVLKGTGFYRTDSRKETVKGDGAKANGSQAKAKEQISESAKSTSPKQNPVPASD